MSEGHKAGDAAAAVVEPVSACLKGAGLDIWRSTRFGNDSGTAFWLVSGPVVTVRDDGEIRIQGRDTGGVIAALKRAGLTVAE